MNQNIKGLDQIKRDFNEAKKTKGPEREKATQACLMDLSVYEKTCLSDPSFGSAHDVNFLHELIGQVQSSLSKMQATALRRK